MINDLVQNTFLGFEFVGDTVQVRSKVELTNMKGFHLTDRFFFFYFVIISIRGCMQKWRCNYQNNLNLATLYIHQDPYHIFQLN